MIFDNYTDYQSAYIAQFPQNREDYTRKILAKRFLRSLGQTVIIKYEHPVELSRLRIYETLNAIVVVMEAKKRGMIVDYNLISLRGRVVTPSDPVAAVLPIS